MNLKPIVHAILKEYALPRYGTHGVSHWARVLENGLRLAAKTDAQIEVIQLFAVFHDSRRINEGIDNGHGQRGADLARQMRGELFDLADEEFSLLCAACAGHTGGDAPSDVTVQICWDSDRLDLERVGIVPDPRRLFTRVAKQPKTLEWASSRARLKTVPELVVRDWGLPAEDITM